MPVPDPDLTTLAERLGYRFEKTELLVQGLTHRSRANEDGTPALGNDRLEFLGDAVLDLVVSEFLMRAHPKADEGLLSRARADAVNTKALADHAQRLGLGQYMRLSRGEERSGGREKPSILANVFEAVLAAVYLDGGLDPARAFIEREFGELLADLRGTLPDPKTRVQEILQALGSEVPQYETVSTEGPDHAKEFQVEVRAAGTLLGTGTGSSKREAEQKAARKALDHLER